MIAGGIGVLGLAIAHDRRRMESSVGEVRIDRRPVAVAIIVGVGLGIAQTAAFLQLPLFFRHVLGYGPVFAVAALAPLILALVAAGPVAGILLQRFAPRRLIGLGAILVGLANLALILIATPVRRVPGVRDPAVPDRRELRRRDDRPDRDHLRERAPRPARDGGGAERGIHLSRLADRDRARDGDRRPDGDRRLRNVGRGTAGRGGRASASAMFRGVLVAVGTPSFSQVAAGVSGVDVTP